MLLIYFLYNELLMRRIYNLHICVYKRHTVLLLLHVQFIVVCIVFECFCLAVQIL